MNNNDILRRTRYTFDLSDDQMIQIFALADHETTRAEVSNWLKKDDHPEQQQLYDKELTIFLNGFINLKRGKKEGPQPKPEKSLNNNIVLRKFKIALNLKDEDILHILDLANFRFGKSELSALFRKPDHQHFRRCKDQVLRNFIYGMQLKYRPGPDEA
ncbi:YehS family protein [Acidiluteibacter ferrifornacis]|uniref:DUF1456 family protein n=1 Tax=Acidiluteibacter ferrifornacis TaxID=2692424 RepID=A0A6N9NME4_9FLAO|nr:DUF1456 family protein [Acidiluteibacter ferrifornacis]NBG67029.1 DUF1456 family protein [Acidiluteibacter ferrifornacis]